MIICHRKMTLKEHLAHATPKNIPIKQFATHRLLSTWLFNLYYVIFKCYLSSSLNMCRCIGRRVEWMADVPFPFLRFMYLYFENIIHKRMTLRETYDLVLSSIQFSFEATVLFKAKKVPNTSNQSRKIYWTCLSHI